MNLKEINIKHSQPILELKDFTRRVAAEGIVLLENKDKILPLINKKVALFGRIQTSYYKSGTGSGGLVNVRHVPSILEAFLESPLIEVDKDVMKTYLDWIQENPFNAGNGMWASEPWSQEEMLLDCELVEIASKRNDAAIIFIGRTAGEDRDNHDGEGSYKLSQKERKMIELVARNFKKFVVVLNVGNIIDMNFVEEFNVPAVLYAWHGGMEGAKSIVDVITNIYSPSGKLPDTIVKDIKDYPGTKYFGNAEKLFYEEDIYVGYRFFETFSREKVLYPFGYDLSYTNFLLEARNVIETVESIKIDIKIKNIGEYDGKEVVQIYYEAPQGKLGKPLRSLSAFGKTKNLLPKEETSMILEFNIKDMASYDDGGLVKKSAYILEKGNYHIYMGTDVRSASCIHTYSLVDDVIVETLEEALAPTDQFKRIKPTILDDIVISFEDVPSRNIDLNKRIDENKPQNIEYANNNLVLTDVYENPKLMNDFIAQFKPEQLAELVRGEGMSSPKVTSGTAAALGGVTAELKSFGFPVTCLADGPSGIRMDSGQIASSLPNGTLIASTMNPSLIEDMYYLEGLEMKNYDIDVLLGPGMNIHRHPLNGRNFEYFSEDPLITGIMASAFVRGLARAGSMGSLKHFACNNQETSRFDVDSVVSERALREIYLKGYEIAVKSANANIIMTSYNGVNGIWAASNYDLCTTILRKEWGFNGLVITDWWAKMNDEHELATKENTKAMIRAQNDAFMVVTDSKNNSMNDNTLESLENKTLSIGELQRSAINIVNYIFRTHSFRKMVSKDDNDKKDYNDWFKVIKPKESYPVNSKSKFLLRNPYQFSYDSKELKSVDSIKDNGYLYKKQGITYLKIKNDSNISLYTFSNINNISTDDWFDKIKNKTGRIFAAPKSNWSKLEVNLPEFIYATNPISQAIISDAKQNDLITYIMNFEKDGKYIFEFVISGSTNSLSQLPFSIYINETRAATITINGTGGNQVTTNSHILIDEGTKYITLKFNKSGLSIYQFKIIKHG